MDRLRFDDGSFVVIDGKDVRPYASAQLAVTCSCGAVAIGPTSEPPGTCPACGRELRSGAPESLPNVGVER